MIETRTKKKVAAHLKELALRAAGFLVVLVMSGCLVFGCLVILCLVFGGRGPGDITCRSIHIPISLGDVPAEAFISLLALEL
jgi:hypothetical protein